MKGKVGRAWLALPVTLAILAVALPMLPIEARGKRPVPASRPGDYSGFSQPIYEEWVRTSQYITVRDGTRLAADIFRPTRDERPVSEPLPVVWTHHRYHRAILWDGHLITMLEYGSMSWLKTLLQHGYVVAIVDVRGSGASYGVWRGPYTPDETLDAYDVTEWFAAQPWSSGDIGMFGTSYMGTTQYLAAGTAPPHLKAIFPEMGLFDMYSLAYPSGVFHSDFVAQSNGNLKRLDAGDFPTAPVDEDGDGSMLAEAIEMHQANIDMYQMAAVVPYRDSRAEETNDTVHFTLSPASYLNEVKNSGVAIYHVAGWFDPWSRDELVWFNNLDNPQKIVIGPWSHTQRDHIDLGAERLRWYDYWLKGINNRVMDEAPIHYYTMGAPADKAWRSAWQWPLPNQELTPYYFHGGPSGSVNSANDGTLSANPPTSVSGQDDYVVDYTTTSGTSTRWDNATGGGFSYPDMAANDEKGLTYTTPPLDSDIEVTGHPVVHLWVTSTANDGDFFVYLEEVDGDGVSHYITEGVLRASHRAVSTPPYDYLGLPYHRSFEEDVADLPGGEPVELVFDLYPTSNIFDAGHRIRVTITGADKDNALTPELSPPPTVSVYRNADYASYIVLPIIPIDPEEAALEAAWPVVTIIAMAVAIAAVLIVVFVEKPAQLVISHDGDQIEQYVQEGLMGDGFE